MISDLLRISANRKRMKFQQFERFDHTSYSRCMLKNEVVGHTKEYDSCVYVVAFKPSDAVNVLPPAVFHA